MIDINVINTIAIGENEINHAVFKKVKDGLKLLNYSYFPFDTNEMDNFKTIAREIKSYSDKDLFTYLTFTSRDIIKDVFPIKGKPKDLKMEVINRIKENYMIELTDFNFDYTLTPMEEMHICYAALIPKKISETIFKDLTKEGFKLITAETDCDSLSRGISKITNYDHFVNLHIRQDDSIFIIYKNGIMTLERQVMNGFNDVVNNLALTASIEPSQAMELLVKKGLDRNKTEDQEYSNISSAIDRVSVQIQRTFDLYFQTYRAEPPNTIVLTGYGNSIPDLDLYFSNIFGIPVFKENLLKFLTSDIEIDYEKLKFLELMVCLGLEE
ncbi:MAG: hypothetical protein N3C60_08655 [Calditerrivibrio sp.]|nr:hypothetical protein [Calditerrivibrio sp.]